MSRTVVDLRDDLIEKAKKVTGLSKKVEIVNLALAQLVKQSEIEKILSLKGKVAWERDLKRMRRNRLGTHG